MARRVQLLACMVACMAATTLALELCPERSSFNGCKRRGCVAVPGRRGSATVVCDECGEGYQLMNRGSRNARCECAVGWAGKANNGICKRCPAGTDIAPGGSPMSSECLKCPAGTIKSADGTECACPAGHFRSQARVEPGLAPYECKLCTGRNQYITGNMHTSRSCSTCPTGQVANKAHTWCVDPKDPDAVPEPVIPGLNVTLSSITDKFARARQRSEEAAVSRMDEDSILESTPMGRFSDSIARLVEGDRSDVAAPTRRGRPDLSQLPKVNLTEAASQLRKVNLTNLSPAELAKLNVSAIVPGVVNGSANSDVRSVLAKVGEGIISALPRIPDPLYVAGLRLDPSVMQDAGLPAARNVPELFSNLMRTTIGDLDTADWN